MRRFNLKRLEDESGISGTGIIAEGVEFTNGWVVMHWLATTPVGISTLSFYPDKEAVLRIHGHRGKTIIQWAD